MFFLDVALLFNLALLATTFDVCNIPNLDVATGNSHLGVQGTKEPTGPAESTWVFRGGWVMCCSRGSLRKKKGSKHAYIQPNQGSPSSWWFQPI